MATYSDRAGRAAMHTGIGTTLLGISCVCPPAAYALMPIWWVHLLVASGHTFLED